MSQLFVVMELLGGDTLRARLQSGALPVKKVIDIAVQIARGPAATHDKHLVIAMRSRTTCSCSRTAR